MHCLQRSDLDLGKNSPEWQSLNIWCFTCTRVYVRVRCIWNEHIHYNRKIFRENSLPRRSLMFPNSTTAELLFCVVFVFCFALFIESFTSSMFPMYLFLPLPTVCHIKFVVMVFLANSDYKNLSHTENTSKSAVSPGLFCLCKESPSISRVQSFISQVTPTRKFHSLETKQKVLCSF